MIQKLQNSNKECSIQIRAVFQSSYAVEARLLEVEDFPPLNRSLEDFINSNNAFYGFFEYSALAGVIEVEPTVHYVDINSLVVRPECFRRGIGRKLIEFAFKEFETKHFIVETGLKNTPAIELYKKLGFKEVKQWDTDFGVRKIQFERRAQ